MMVADIESSNLPARWTYTQNIPTTGQHAQGPHIVASTITLNRFYAITTSSRSKHPAVPFSEDPPTKLYKLRTSPIYALCNSRPSIIYIAKPFAQVSTISANEIAIMRNRFVTYQPAQMQLQQTQIQQMQAQQIEFAHQDRSGQFTAQLPTSATYPSISVWCLGNSTDVVESAMAQGMGRIGSESIKQRDTTTRGQPDLKTNSLPSPPQSNGTPAEHTNLTASSPKAQKLLARFLRLYAVYTLPYHRVTSIKEIEKEKHESWTR